MRAERETGRRLMRADGGSKKMFHVEQLGGEKMFHVEQLGGEKMFHVEQWEGEKMFHVEQWRVCKMFHVEHSATSRGGILCAVGRCGASLWAPFCTRGVTTGVPRVLLRASLGPEPSCPRCAFGLRLRRPRASPHALPPCTRGYRRGPRGW